ncbi:hypothetical protein ACHQM5_016279 [Ranunculus cassubicifolius]
MAEATSNLKCVVVAVDSSEESMKSLRWALDNLKFESPSTATLHILTVQPPPSLSSGINPGAIPFGGPKFSEVPAFAAAIEAHQKRISDAIIDHALKICEDEKTQINIETKIVVGDAKEVICQVVEQLKADLLVMGSHSYGPIKRMFLGSVSNYCTNQAQCPVMVVKESS